MTQDPQPTPALEAAARRRRELREALVAFEDALSSPLRDHETWRRKVTEHLEGLMRAFEVHVDETERPGGLYDEMEETAPHLRAKASRLREEHAPIAADLGAAEASLAAPLEPDVDMEALRDDLQRMMGRIVRHRRHGSDLVWEAYAIDIGTAG